MCPLPSCIFFASSGVVGTSVALMLGVSFTTHLPIHPPTWVDGRVGMSLLVLTEC